jgi:hypothetical protein
MIHDQNIARQLYKKLLAFYPKAFKEQLGESMDQTFHDLWNEKRQAKKELFGSVLWIFIETAIGIFRERLLLIIEGDIMQTILTNLRLPAMVSFLLILPFMIMEVVNRQNFNEGFPVPLFIFMWVLPVLFILISTPIIRSIRAGNSILVNPIVRLIRVILLAFIVWMWFGILIDQLPCFLGVPNCD